MDKASNDSSNSRILGQGNEPQKQTEQITLFKREDLNFDADKDLKERQQKRKSEKEAADKKLLEEKKLEDENRERNEVDWEEVNKFTKSSKYTGHLCITVHNKEYLNEHTNMTYQYIGYDGTMQDGAMSGGSGYNCLRTLDRGIHDFFRICENHKIPGKMFFSKEAEELINKWIEESNHYIPGSPDKSTFKQIQDKIRADSNPSDEAWDEFEYQAIKERGYEIGVNLLRLEYIEWRRRVMEYQPKDIEKWQEMWQQHGPSDWYIERVLHAIETYNFHASRLRLKLLEEPSFIPQWKKELAELTEKRRAQAEKASFDLAKKRKEDRKIKSDARKKEKADKEATNKSARQKTYGTPFTDKMKAAKTANEGRDIISEYEEAFASLEKEAGLSPTVGEGGSGCASRGFSTLTKTEIKKAIKRLSNKNAELGEKLKALIDDIKEAEEAWEVLYKEEIGKMMENVHCKDARKREAK